VSTNVARRDETILLTTSCKNPHDRAGELAVTGLPQASLPAAPRRTCLRLYDRAARLELPAMVLCLQTRAGPTAKPAPTGPSELQSGAVHHRRQRLCDHRQRLCALTSAMYAEVLVISTRDTRPASVALRMSARPIRTARSEGASLASGMKTNELVLTTTECTEKARIQTVALVLLVETVIARND
jgi:hypothetical protein